MYNEAAPMKPLQEALLKAVRTSGGAWLSRREIAKLINRPGRLNPYDVQILEQLVSDGYIEASKRIRGTVLEERIYRSKGQRVAGDVVPIPYAPEDEE